MISVCQPLYAYVCFYVVSVKVIDHVTVAVGEIDVPNTNDLFCADAHGSYSYSEHTRPRVHVLPKHRIYLPLISRRIKTQNCMKFVF